MNSEILKPMVVLIAWTILMLLWLVATRLPAMKKVGVDLGKLVGGKGTDADGVLPPKTQWIAHNHNHLMEQPTLFYAVCTVIALTGTGNGVNAYIAWGYVALRILHSLWQTQVNKVSIRFLIFLLATVCLGALTLHAAMAVFAWHHG